MKWDTAPICIRAKAIVQLAAWPKTGLRNPGSNLVINPVISARLAAFPYTSSTGIINIHIHILVKRCTNQMLTHLEQ